MKKYITLTTVTVFLLTTLSIYYIHSALIENDRTQFYIEQTGGDKGLIKDINVSSSYYTGNRDETITISDEETSYISDLPFLEKIDYEDLSSSSKQYQKLKKDYPSFMRGKHNEASLFKDDSQVIYAQIKYSHSLKGEMNDFRFSINMLNKKDKQTNSYTINVPNQKNINQMEVYDVQYLYDEVRIVTANQQANPYLTEVHQYTINLKKERITDDRIIFTQNETTADYYSTMSITERHALQPSNIVMFQTEESQVNEDGETRQSEHKIYIYHYEDAKLSELILPAELQTQMVEDISYMYDKEYLYACLTIYDEPQTAVTMYKIDWKTGKTVDTINLTNNDNYNIEWVTLNEEYIQIFSRDTEDHPIFAIYSLEDGKLIFEGRVAAKNPDSVDFIYFSDVYIHGISGI